MLRLLIPPFLCLLIIFTGVGALFSRQWGWSEYASDELYAVYYQSGEDGNRFFITSADGKHEEAPLTWNRQPLTWLDCSPDGRTVAFLSAATHLYVANNTGLLYDRALNTGTSVNVANNGVVTSGSGLLVDSRQALAVASPDLDAYADWQVTASGFSLWSKPLESGVALVSPVEEVVSLPEAFAPSWLASEEIFTFNDWGPKTYGRYLEDAATRIRVRLKNLGVFGAFSPDATKNVSSLLDRRTGNNRIVVAETFSNSFVLLSRNPQVSYRPRCFLTFRPEMLIEKQG